MDNLKSIISEYLEEQNVIQCRNEEEISFLLEDFARRMCELQIQHCIEIVEIRDLDLANILILKSKNICE